MRDNVKVDWWLAGICSARTFTYTVAMTYAAALPILQLEWGMTASKAGSIASAHQIGYAVSLFIFSSLADRVGPKPLYLGSVLASGFFALVFAFFASGYLSALILYTILAFSLGGTYTTGLMILADQYPARKRGMAAGFFIASTSLGYVMSLGLSGLTIPLGGYRLSFLVTCICPVVGAILSWATLINTRVSPVRRQKKHRFKKEILENKPAMLLIGGYTFHNWELLGMWAWTPAFLASWLAMNGTGELSSATGFGSYLAASFHMAGLIASFTMGSLSDRLGRVRVIMILSGISTVCSFVFGWSIGWPLIVVIGIGFVYAFSSLGDSPVLSAALTEVVTPSYLGTAFGIRSLLGFGAGAISPLVFGVVLDWTNPVRMDGSYYSSWGWSFVMLGLAGLCALLTAFKLGRIHKE